MSDLIELIELIRDANRQITPADRHAILWYIAALESQIAAAEKQEPVATSCACSKSEGEICVICDPSRGVRDEVRAPDVVRGEDGSPETDPMNIISLEEVNLIAADGFRNAAGGIYATRVYEFAQEIAEVVREKYATPLQSEGLRKDAEDLIKRIPTTPEQMVDFIGNQFNSMEAQEWTDERLPKPAGNLSMVRYSLTVHDLLSAFEWADMDKEAIDAALAQQEKP